MYIDPPPAINSITVDEICTNDFTVSWTSTSNDTGLLYTVTLLPDGETLITTSTSYNFRGLIPNSNYNVTIVPSSSLGTGIPTIIMVTTLMIESEKLMISKIRTYVAVVNNSVVVFCATYVCLYNAHSCTYVCMHTYVCMYVHTYIHTYIHTYVCTYIHTYICTYIHAYVHTYMHMYIHTCIHTCIYTYICTYIHAYICDYVMNEGRTVGKEGIEGSGIKLTDLYV